MRFSHCTPFNAECATQYSNDQFSILAKARSMFHLSVLEATYKPILYRQIEFFCSLQIFHLQRCSLFKVLRTSGFIKEIRTKSSSMSGDSNPQPLDCRSIALPPELI